MGWTNGLRRLALVAAILGGIGGGGQWAAAQSTAPAPPPAAAQPDGTVPPGVAPSPPAGSNGAAPAAPATSGGTGGASPAAPPAPGSSSATPPTPAPSGSGAAPPAPPSGTAAPAAPSGPASPQPTPPSGTDATNPAGKTVPDTSISQTIELQPRPVIMLSGQSTWDEGFKTLNDSFTKLTDALNKANVHGAGNPMAIFTETDDSGFKFSAMIPVDKAPEGKPDVPADISFGTSPGGKVMRFQHRSAYDDIDSTYEAITAYLDEKGIEAKNIFAEEYLNRTKSSDDPSLEVDIDVFLK